MLADRLPPNAWRTAVPAPRAARVAPRTPRSLPCLRVSVSFVLPRLLRDGPFPQAAAIILHSLSRRGKALSNLACSPRCRAIPSIADCGKRAEDRLAGDDAFLSVLAACARH